MKKNIIANLIRKYNIQSAEDIQDALKDLLGETIESMLTAEMDNHLGHSPYELTHIENTRNGKKQKMIHSKYGEMKIDILQDCNSSFEPKIVKKKQKDFSNY